MKAVRAEEMRRLDDLSIRRIGIPGQVLMENAGRGAFDALVKELGGAGSRRVLILCGPGNNGGDGYVLARHLWNVEARVLIVATRDPKDLAGDAFLHAGIAVNMGIPLRVVSELDEVEELFEEMGPPDAIVDALLGTGADRPLDGVLQALVDYANETPCLRMALDVPTGVHSDTGRELGTPFRATLTASFGLPKLGLFLPPGSLAAGKIAVVDISIPRDLLEEAEGADLLEEPACVPSMPGRAPHTHKGEMGHVLVVGGARGKTGAGLLASMAALRTGAGLCTLAVPEHARPLVEGRFPDVMIESWPDSEDGWGALLQGKTVVAVGPGLGTDAVASAALEALLRLTHGPVVADADALTLLSRHTEWLAQRESPTVLTPHPGEAARLAGTSTSEVQSDRIQVARDLAEQMGVVVVLKGAGTVVAGFDGGLALNRVATQALSKGGTGDVLTGVISALIGMGLVPEAAARLGVWLHGKAGQLVAERRGVHGLTATDLLEAIPEAVQFRVGS